MIRHILAIAVALYPPLVASETIGQFIVRNNLQYVQSLNPISPSITPNIVHSFQRIAKLDRSGKLIMLKVSNGPSTAITSGTTVVIHYSLETMTELQRSFIIAHEIGHISLNHLQQKIDLYEKHVPGDITPRTAEIADRIVGPEIRTLSHKVEFEADVYALKTLISLGWTREQVIAMFLDWERFGDTATHPSTARRVQNLIKAKI